MDARDEFSPAVKRTTALRVNYLCSNPSCCAPTSGPQIDLSKALNIGVASHITAAAVGGPRYNHSLSQTERKDANNAIWLCQNCGKLIDNDPTKFTESDLRQWKQKAEEKAFQSIGKSAVNTSDDFDDMFEELKQIAQVFVAPTQYNDALAKLGADNLLILAGPAHIGKTATALHLALDLNTNNDRSIIKLKPSDDVKIRRLPPNSIIIFDDYFGEIVLTEPSHANNFPDVERLARLHTVIVTTRSSVLDAAKQSTKLGEQRSLARYTVALQQDDSYDNIALKSILFRHLEFMQSDALPKADRLSNKQVTLAQKNWHQIVSELRFPHNIERLCKAHLYNVAYETQLAIAIAESKYIEVATQQWVESLPSNEQWFVFLVALFPAIEMRVLDAIYRKIAIAFSFATEDSSNLFSKTVAYIYDRRRPNFSHPSYHAAIIDLLREKHEHRVAEVVDLGLHEVTRSDIFSLSRCADADYGWLRHQPGEPFHIQKYLEPLLFAYNALRNQVFPEMKLRLPPYNNEDASCLFLLNPSQSGGALLFVQSPDGVAKMFAEEPTNFRERIQELMAQARTQLMPLSVFHIFSDDLIFRSPHIHALTIMRGFFKNIFEKQRLAEAWPITHARIEMSLCDSSFKMIGIELRPELSFDFNNLVGLCQDMEHAQSQAVPHGFIPMVWQNNLRNAAHSLMALNYCINKCHKNNKPYLGRLLTQPDLDFSENSRTRFDLFSESQMKMLIQQTLELAFEAYEQMVDNNFGSLKSRMLRPNKLPYRVLGAVMYGGDDWSKRRSCFYFLPSSFPTRTNTNFEIYTIAHSTNHEDPVAFPPDVEQRIKDAEAYAWYEMNPVSLSTFGNLKEFIALIYKWIEYDVEKLMNWQKLGNERGRNLSQASQKYAAANGGITPVHDFTDLQEGFDWP